MVERITIGRQFRFLDISYVNEILENWPALLWTSGYNIFFSFDLISEKLTPGNYITFEKGTNNGQFVSGTFYTKNGSIRLLFFRICIWEFDFRNEQCPSVNWIWRIWQRRYPSIFSILRHHRIDNVNDGHQLRIRCEFCEKLNASGSSVRSLERNHQTFMH